MSRPVKILVGTVALFVVLAIAAWLSRPAYHRYKEHRALNRAHAFLQAGNIRDAHFSLRQALTLNPTNAEAVQLMADVLAQTHSPATLAWRQRAVELSPTTQNKLMLGTTALQFERAPFPVTAQIVEELKPVGSTNANWHVLASELALRRGRLAEAITQMQAAADLEPTNRIHQINVALLNSRSTNAESAAAAREQLSKMTGDPVLGDHAVRILIADSLQKKQFEDAKQLSDRLLSSTNAQFPDRLQRLTILTALKSPETNAWLGTLKAQASTNVLSAALLAQWMNEHQQALQAREWIGSLPANIRTTPPLPLIVTAGYVAANDWHGLETWLTDQRWNDDEYLRFAWLARAVREQQNRTEMADVYWQRAKSAAEARIETLSVLTQLAASWNWNSETVELLRSVTRRDPNQTWAWDALRQRLAAAGDTAGLHEVVATLFARNTNSVMLKNDLTMLDLLLNQNTDRAFRFAKELYEQQTNNAVVVSTYALALYRQNKAGEALAVMQSLPDQVLIRPDIAVYYSLLLAANGHRDSAAPYQAAALQAPMLPEEKRLLEKYYPKN